MDGEHAKLAADASDANPVLVELWRSDAVESFHRGAAAIATAPGEIMAAWGDIDRPIFPRSAVKMLQALPLLETGAAGGAAVVSGPAA